MVFEIREWTGQRGGALQRQVRESIGYVTPNDEHEGRGAGIRQARRDGLTAADRARRAARAGGLPS